VKMCVPKSAVAAPALSAHYIIVHPKMILAAAVVIAMQWERRPPARRVAHRAVPEAGAPKRGFALTSYPPCDTLRAWRNLHWDAVSARCWAAIRF
jgi:hypothetical protein